MTRGIKKGDWGAIYPDRAACTGKGPDGVDVFYIIVNSTVDSILYIYKSWKI
jgi:hypothetical protein